MKTIYEHIQKRVEELGFTNYSLQPVFIQVNTTRLIYDISAYNELYFLMGQIPTGTRIISDTFAIKTDASFNSSEIKPFYEFSGFIEIILPHETTNSIEFLKVILQ